MDQALGNDIDIGKPKSAYWFATQGDGTLLGPNSFKEQDVVKLWIGLGQEHPDGLLQLSDTEVVQAFQSDTNVMAVMCHLTAAKVWWGKWVMLHILPLKGRQVRRVHCQEEQQPFWLSNAYAG